MRAVKQKIYIFGPVGRLMMVLVIALAVVFYVPAMTVSYAANETDSEVLQETGEDSGQTADVNEGQSDGQEDSETGDSTEQTGEDTDPETGKNDDQTGEKKDPETGTEPDTEKTEKDPPAGVLRKSSVTLYVGWESYEIFIDELDEESTVTYKTTNKKIATVDEDGIVTPKKKGSAKIKVVIKAKDGAKKTLVLSVKVKNPYSEVIDFNDSITTEGSYTFKLKRYGHDGEVTWKLDGSQYATIEAVSDTDCRISGIAVGDVTLSVSCGDFEESFDIHVYEGKGTAFKITPEKHPYNGNYEGRSEYNQYTKDYFIVRSYLERLSSLGGGMLIFAEGTYSITNTLCIPSNTTILLEDGATILKSDYTGTSWLTATQSLFQTVSYSHTQTPFTKYNGEHDITIKGEGSATIDLNFVKSNAITAAHCLRLTITGIAFRNLNSLHFIELDASKDVEISGNLFSGCIASPTQRKEAINIDTPDLETHGFAQGWTSYDCTPDKNVSICDNVFENLETAIGTHKYSEGKYHTNISIERNAFVNVTSYVVRMMNWKKCKVSDNYFILTDREDADKTVNAVILNGAVNPTVTGNTFVNFTTAIRCAHWKNSGSGKIYAETYNELSKANLKAMKKNAVVDCTNNYFEVYTEFGDNTDKFLETYKFSGTTG